MSVKFKQKRNLETLPKGSTTGVRAGVGSGLRTIKMVKPLCPAYELNDKGVLVPSADNCQVVYRHPLWHRLCTHADNDALYWQSVESIVPQLLIEEREIDGKKVKVVTGQEQVLQENTHLNLTQVPMNERISSGRAIGDARYRGYKTLEELGYRRSCEYANCFNQPDELYNTVYGFFCTEQQARLVGADVEAVVLEVWDDKKRARQLRDIELYAES